MRPELKGLLWPNQLKKGLSDLLKDGMLEFIVKQLPLIVSKSEDKWAIRAYWCLKYPALLAQMLTERSILDGSFEDSMHFSYLQECIVVVYGIDKADKDTGASLRVGNRRGGNSSKHTQLLAATENAAETYVNLRETFMSSKYPLRGYLQQLTYDYYHMLVIRIGMKVCRCITYQPTPSQEQCTERLNNEESIPEIERAEAETKVKEADAHANEAFDKALKHARNDTHLEHQIKLSKGYAELKKLLQGYVKDSSKKPRGPAEYSFKAALVGVGAKFLTHHGGNDLTTDNGMDVMDNFDDAASFAEQSYPEESEEGKKIRDFFELCRQLAKDLAELLSFMKSQKKCNEKDFLDRLDKFLKSWDAALPDKKYFLKLHHLIFHVIEFIKQYGMYGRVSAEGFEAIHALIKKLKEMSQSQSTLNRTKTTNGKAQAVMKPQVMVATDKYTKGSTGKKRGTYKKNPSTQSTDAAESLEAYKTVTVGGEEFIEVFGGEGRIPKKYEDLWRLLTTSFVPPAWVELFQSSTTIPQNKKRKICSTAELNL
mmetsp:Transcript_4914/g.6192  ORF Transcript_4914/g.6192 Transcript_4914/m.6192 type:complete len:540 (+) Transcript_4914:904-2523(+)